MKYFNCYYNDNGFERTITIVKAKNIEDACAILEKKYEDIDVSDWEIEEMNFTNGCCEVYYGS